MCSLLFERDDKRGQDTVYAAGWNCKVGHNGYGAAAGRRGNGLGGRDASWDGGRNCSVPYPMYIHPHFSPHNTCPQSQ